MSVRGYIQTLLNALPVGTRQPVQQAFDALYTERSGVTAGTYGSSTAIPVLTIDGRGRVTAASAATFAAGSAVGGATYSSAVGNEPTANAGDLYFPTNGMSIERYSGSAWVPWGPIFPLTAPALAAPTTWINQGGASVTTANGGIVLNAPASAGNNVRIRKKTAPSTPYTITAAFIGRPIKQDFINFGLVFRQSSDGKLATCQVQHSAAGGSGFVLRSNKYTNETTNSAAYVTVPIDFVSPVFLRITDNGTNRVCSFSTDGVNFYDVHSVGRTDFLTADEVGFFAESNNATYPALVTLLSWKET